MIAPYAAGFGLKNPASELELISADQVEGRKVTRFQQVYKGVPVMGGEMIVNATDQAELLSLSAEISPDLSLDITPTISPRQAQTAALGSMAKSHQVSKDALVATEPELWIYDLRLLEPDGRPATLVWRLEVKSKDGSLGVNELVLVDAKRGAIVLNFNQIDTAWKPLASEIEYQENISPTAKALQGANWPIYFEIALDETRGWIYGSDFTGNKIDVISTDTLQLVKSITLVNGANPKGIA